MAIRTTRESDNKNKARRESLREPRHGQSVFGNTPRDSRKRQGKRRKTCGTPANTKAFPARLAGLPQTPKHFPWDLREYPQTPTHFPWDLRDSRKHQRISRGTCNGVTSISKNTLLVTAIYPSHSSGIRSLILSLKLTLQRFLEKEIRSRGHPFRPRSIVGRPYAAVIYIRSADLIPLRTFALNEQAIESRTGFPLSKLRLLLPR